MPTSGDGPWSGEVFSEARDVIRHVLDFWGEVLSGSAARDVGMKQGHLSKFVKHGFEARS